MALLPEHYRERFTESELEIIQGVVADVLSGQLPKSAIAQAVRRAQQLRAAPKDVIEVEACEHTQSSQVSSPDVAGRASPGALAALPQPSRSTSPSTPSSPPVADVPLPSRSVKSAWRDETLQHVVETEQRLHQSRQSPRQRPKHSAAGAARVLEDQARPSLRRTSAGSFSGSAHDGPRETCTSGSPSPGPRSLEGAHLEGGPATPLPPLAPPGPPLTAASRRYGRAVRVGVHARDAASLSGSSRSASSSTDASRCCQSSLSPPAARPASRPASGDSSGGSLSDLGGFTATWRVLATQASGRHTGSVSPPQPPSVRQGQTRALASRAVLTGTNKSARGVSTTTQLRDWPSQQSQGRTEGTAGLPKQSSPARLAALQARQVAWQARIQQQSERLRESASQAEIRECTFMPRLCSRGRRLDTLSAGDDALQCPRARSLGAPVTPATPAPTLERLAQTAPPLEQRRSRSQGIAARTRPIPPRPLRHAPLRRPATAPVVRRATLQSHPVALSPTSLSFGTASPARTRSASISPDQHTFADTTWAVGRVLRGLRPLADDRGRDRAWGGPERWRHASSSSGSSDEGQGSADGGARRSPIAQRVRPAELACRRLYQEALARRRRFQRLQAQARREEPRPWRARPMSARVYGIRTAGGNAPWQPQYRSLDRSMRRLAADEDVFPSFRPATHYSQAGIRLSSVRLAPRSKSAGPFFSTVGRRQVRPGLVVLRDTRVSYGSRPRESRPHDPKPPLCENRAASVKQPPLRVQPDASLLDPRQWGVSDRLDFEDFLHRQARHAAQKERHVAELRRDDELALQARPALSPGSKRILARSRGRTHTATLGQRRGVAGTADGRLAIRSEPYEVLPDTSFTLLSRRGRPHQRSSDADPECTFEPRILPASQARTPRGVDAMVYSDAAAREGRLEEQRWLQQCAEDAEASGRPRLIEPPPGIDRVQSMVRSPGFLRVYQRQLDELAAQHERRDREREARELKECTFTPKTGRLPAFIKHLIATNSAETMRRLEAVRLA